MSPDAEDILRELRALCQDGEQRFAAALSPGAGTAGTPEPGRSRPAIPPVWAWEMHGHTEIPIRKLLEVFRVSDGEVVPAVKPKWRTRSNAERLRCVATLTLMGAQLVSGRGSRPGGVPLAELEERCKVVPLVEAPSGELKRVLERNRFKDAYRIAGAVPTVSFTMLEVDGSRTLTPHARAACVRAVAAALPIKRR